MADSAFCAACTEIFQSTYVPAWEILRGICRFPQQYSTCKAISKPASNTEHHPRPSLHHSLKSLGESRQNCSLCALFYEQIRSCGKFWLDGSADAEEAKLYGILLIYPVGNHGVGLFNFGFVHCFYEEGKFTWYDYLSMPSLRAIDLSIPENRKTWISKRSRQDTVARLVKWLEVPQASMSTVSRRLPARLLSITSSEAGDQTLKIRILDSQTLPSTLRYAALSHPWGECQPLKLMKDSVNEFKRDIPFDSLPATFRDAVKLVSSLGISYLWIDSLCIIQDCKEDWQTEASLMASVYMHACVTISAVAADNPSTGLESRSMLCMPCEFTPTWQGLDDFHLPAGPIRLVEMGQYCEQVLLRPPFRRGWIYQEWLLSSKIIYYARDQLWWSSKEDESGYMYNETCNGYSYSIFYHVALTTPRPDVYKADLKSCNDDGASARFVWREMLQDYSTRHFTFETDRPIAFAGIVTLYQQLTGVLEDAYFAGLWRHSLLKDLLWTVSDGRRVSPPQAYRAPSWSWESMEPIHVPSPKFALDYKNETGQSEWKETGPSVISVKDIQVTTPGSRLGSVSDGFLVLHGPLIKCHLMTELMDFTRFPPNPAGHGFVLGIFERFVYPLLSLHPSQPKSTVQGPYYTPVSFDDTFQFNPSDQLLTVYAAVFDYHITLNGYTESHALLLMRGLGKGEYHRIGYALLRPDILLENTKKGDFRGYVQLHESEYLRADSAAGYYTYRVV